jgi:hypothetical protein
MPEMLQHVGKRFTVSKRVEKICDTAHFTGKPPDRPYWRGARLRRVNPPC